MKSNERKGCVMWKLDEKQIDTAKTIARRVSSLRPDQSALWQLSGAVGSGKTTVLRRIAEQLRVEQLIPLTVTAPAGEIDAAPIALIETAGELRSHGLLNGEIGILADPKRRWSEKMAAIIETVERNRDHVVLLCDEPRGWYRLNESQLDGSPDHNARSLADWMVNRVQCRRIVAGWISNDSPAGRIWAPRLDDGRQLLEDNIVWGALRDCASGLRGALPDPVSDRSAWEMKLCVAITALSSSDAAAQLSKSQASAKVLLDQVLDLVEQRSDMHDLGATIVRLALARTDLDESVLSEFTSGLDVSKRSLIEHCLLDWDGKQAALHPLIRNEISWRASEPRPDASQGPWRLFKADLMSAHDRLKDEYLDDGNASLRNSLESLHHDLLGTTPHLLESDPRLQFVEQLDGIGRTRSRVYHEHRQAASIFRLAVRLDPNHAYGHHYLAFNLDWLAEETHEVEAHYKKAIDLQPTHPWWWSRWISYLATRGRFQEAKSTWRTALDTLSPDEDGSPEWIFLSLHRWVARWLLHWVELDFAEDVLRAIPRHFAQNDASIQTLWDLLKALRQAQHGTCVFPLSIPAKDWWSPSPHTDLPPSWDGQPLRFWVPARIEGVDKECSVAFLVAAKRPPTRGADPVHFEMELSRATILKAAHGFEWENLQEGSFIELGHYGDGMELMRVGLHRDTTWYDPNLLPLVPPPDRWYRRAVESAWAEMERSD
jgi:tetratricopeptide (TPR) repeat protein